MSTISSGYVPRANDIAEESVVEFVRLLLANSSAVLTNQNYFFVSANGWSFCSWPYLSGDGTLFAGYLLNGWQHGLLIDSCEECTSQLYLIGFAGSPLSDRNSFWGVCLQCNSRKRGHSSGALFLSRMDYVLKLRRLYPVAVKSESCVLEEIAHPPAFEQFIDQMKNGMLQQGVKPNVSDITITASCKFGPSV